MPNYRTWFPSKFISAADLLGGVVPVVIAEIVLEEMPNGDGEQKPVIYFEGAVKGLVTNKTNARRIAGLFGENTDSWIGKEVLLYASETDLRGETVPCVRVQIEQQAKQQAAPPRAPADQPPEPTSESPVSSALGNARPRL